MHLGTMSSPMLSMLSYILAVLVVLTIRFANARPTRDCIHGIYSLILSILINSSIPNEAAPLKIEVGISGVRTYAKMSCLHLHRALSICSRL